MKKLILIIIAVVVFAPFTVNAGSSFGIKVHGDNFGFGSSSVNHGHYGGHNSIVVVYNNVYNGGRRHYNKVVHRQEGRVYYTNDRCRNVIVVPSTNRHRGRYYYDNY